MPRHHQSLLDNPFDNIAWGHPSTGKIECVLILSKKKERILVGTAAAIKGHLRTPEASDFLPVPIPARTTVDVVQNALHATQSVFESGLTETLKKVNTNHDLEEITYGPELFCDCTYDLGHLLQSFEYDSENRWTHAIDLLSSVLYETHHKKLNTFVEEAKNILLEKWNTNDPICRYVSLRIWQEYLTGAGDFKKAMPNLIKAFSIPPQPLEPTRKAISRHAPFLRLPYRLSIEEEQIKLWIPSDLDFEGIVVENSLFPLKLYYQRFLNENHLKYSLCIVCGKVFLTNTNKQKLCSSTCETARKKLIKARYDDKARANSLEVECKRHYQFWYNRIKKAQGIPGFPQDRLEEMERAFAVYRKQSLEQKHLSMHTSKPIVTFRDWAYQQEHIILALMGEYEARIQQK